MLGQARALLFGAGARAFFFARDAAVLRGDVRRVWRELQALRAARPPHRASFEAVRRARAAGLPLEALTFGDTPVSVAMALLREAGVGRGDVVVDPLAGRGNVLLAARALGAEARGVELDAGHVEVAAPVLAQLAATLEVGDARAQDYASASCVFLAWTCLPAEARAAIGARLAATAAPGTRVVALTWDPPGTVVARARRAMPWGVVDVVHAAVR